KTSLLLFPLGTQDADGGRFYFGGDFFGVEACARSFAAGDGDVVFLEELSHLAGRDGHAVAVLEPGVGGFHGDHAHDVAAAVEHGAAGIAGVDLGVGDDVCAFFGGGARGDDAARDFDPGPEAIDQREAHDRAFRAVAGVVGF